MKRPIGIAVDGSIIKLNGPIGTLEVIDGS